MAGRQSVVGPGLVPHEYTASVGQVESRAPSRVASASRAAGGINGATGNRLTRHRLRLAADGNTAYAEAFTPLLTPPTFRMSSSRFEINRPLTGLLALACLTLGGVCWAGHFASDMMAAGFIRSGLLLAAIWLALPTRNRPAAWENVSWSSVVLLLLIVVVFVSSRLRWYAIPVALIVLAAVYFLHRPRRRP